MPMRPSLELPHLFAADFQLANFDQHNVKKDITPLTSKKEWTHRDGMEVAWKLVACDPGMKNFSHRFRYFSGDGNPSLRTEQLLEQFITSGIARPISPENPIAFVVNAQGAAKTKEMIKTFFAHKPDGSVDLLVARPVAEEIEERLYHDTPQQRAMVKLFHFYRILETLAKRTGDKEVDELSDWISIGWRYDCDPISRIRTPAEENR